MPTGTSVGVRLFWITRIGSGHKSALHHSKLDKYDEARTICTVNPRPNPEIIWYPAHIPVDEVDTRVLINPEPTETIKVPTMTNGKM